MANSIRWVQLAISRWLRQAALVALIAVGVTGSVSPALAQGFVAFGINESLRPLEATDVTDPEGDELWLAYKVSMYVLFGSWWVRGDGYVLVDLPNLREYFPLTEADIAAYQRAGTLPSPLPPYKLSIVDYVLGFSGWIFIVGVLCWFGARRVWQRYRLTRSR